MVLESMRGSKKIFPGGSELKVGGGPTLITRILDKQIKKIKKFPKSCNS